MAKQNITTAMASMKIGSADKKTLITLFNALVDDIELLRSKQAALCVKLDANHAAAVDHSATLGIAASAISVVK